MCHNVLVHPPGGLVGGDTLDLHVQVGTGAHGLITTPGATRFYRSEGQLALQRTQLTMQADSRLEWLPQERIGYNACLAENRLTLNLRLPDAQRHSLLFSGIGLALVGVAAAANSGL